LAYSCLLKNVLLGANIEDIKGQYDARRAWILLEGMKLFQVKYLYFSRYQTTTVTAIMIKFSMIQLLEFLQTALACNHEALKIYN
jgi:hypothetical protein